MKVTSMRDTVKNNPILAILRNVNDEILIDYVKAIMAGGVKFFEVALNTEGATRQIKMLKGAFGEEILVGAGTAITVSRAKAALAAGADFLLAPSTDEAVLKFAKKRGVQMLPGVLTPTDVSVALRYGFDTLKLFPARDMPSSYVKSLKGPFDNTEYVAIGGVSYENAGSFLDTGCIGIGLGSNIAPMAAVKQRDWETVTEYVRKLYEKVEERKLI